MQTMPSKLTPPVRRKRVYAKPAAPFPVPISSISGRPAGATNWTYYAGQLVDSHVLVDRPFMEDIYHMGYFGKGNLSRHEPNFEKEFWGVGVKFGQDKSNQEDKGNVLRMTSKRKYIRHLAWNKQKAVINCEIPVDAYSESEELVELGHELIEGSSEHGREVEEEKSDRYVSPTKRRKLSGAEIDTCRDPSRDVSKSKTDIHEIKDQVSSNHGNREENWPATQDDRDPWAVDNEQESERFWGKGEENPWFDSKTDDSEQFRVVKYSNSACSTDTSDLPSESANVALAEPSVSETEHAKNTNAPPSQFPASPVRSSMNKSEDPSGLGLISLHTTVKSSVITEQSKSSSSSLQVGEGEEQNLCDAKIAPVVSNSSNVGNDKQKPDTEQPYFPNCNLKTDSETCDQDTGESPLNLTVDTNEICLHQKVENDGGNCGIHETREASASPRHVHVDRRCQSEDEDGDLLVLDDTDESDYEVSMATHLDWHPVRKCDPFRLQESLQLTLEEAFFLSYSLGCLVIFNENKEPMDVVKAWQTFCKRKKRFVPNYVAYHNLRSKGWVLKSGINFGAPFVIYKEGPPFYHASYVAVVKMVDENTLREDPEFGTDCHDNWAGLSGMDRVAEKVAKELLYCYVFRPSDMTLKDMESPKCISRFKIQEVVMKRWVPKAERERKIAE